MKIQNLITPLFCFVLYCMPSVLLAQSVNNIYQIDLATDNNRSFSAANTGQAKIRAIHLLPAQADKYDFANVVSVTPVTPLTSVNLQPASPVVNAAIPKRTAVNCAALYESIIAVEKLDTESKVPAAVATMNQAVVNAKPAGYPGTTTPCLSHPTHTDLDRTNLEQWIKRAEELDANTSRTISIDVERNRTNTLSINRGDRDWQVIVNGPQKQFLTHVGFTFYDNKDQRYFSKAIVDPTDSSTSYEIARQSDKSGVSYAATALFTYPMKTLYQDIDWGLTAGLSANQNSVSVLAGVSLIIHENLLITYGLTIQEFDVLRGIYQVGQNVGMTAQDSSTLTEKTFKATPMLTFGYRFGR